MKITKFAQSCLMIESQRKKILIDPGNIELKNITLSQWKEPDFVFVTHRHGDHFNEEAFNKIKKDTTKIFSTQEVASTYPNTKFEILRENAIINIKIGEVRVVRAVHGYLPFLTKNNAEINENVGYIIEIEKKKLYFTSDSISFKNNYKCQVLFVPICNHGLVMGPFEAALFAKETGANLVIPIHYDNPKFPADLEKVKEEFDNAGLHWKFLEIGETIEI
jgi:L-ascorbate metabolism protein UlaG (beta-lactamase superfamily)